MHRGVTAIDVSLVITVTLDLSRLHNHDLARVVSRSKRTARDRCEHSRGGVDAVSPDDTAVTVPHISEGPWRVDRDGAESDSSCRERTTRDRNERSRCAIDAVDRDAAANIAAIRTIRHIGERA